MYWPTAQLVQVLPAPLETEPGGHCWQVKDSRLPSRKKVCVPQHTDRGPNEEQCRELLAVQLSVGHLEMEFFGTYTLAPRGVYAVLAGNAVDRLLSMTKKEYPGRGSAPVFTISI
jgi:hypothetical protein